MESGGLSLHSCPHLPLHLPTKQAPVVCPRPPRFLLSGQLVVSWTKGQLAHSQIAQAGVGHALLLAWPSDGWPFGELSPSLSRVPRTGVKWVFAQQGWAWL